MGVGTTPARPATLPKDGAGAGRPIDYILHSTSASGHTRRYRTPQTAEHHPEADERRGLRRLVGHTRKSCLDFLTWAQVRFGEPVPHPRVKTELWLRRAMRLSPTRSLDQAGDLALALAPGMRKRRDAVLVGKVGVGSGRQHQPGDLDMARTTVAQDHDLE